MIRIGIVDLDTTHPQAFTRILRAIPGVEVSALWDGHDVWPEGYDRRFAAANDIPVVCASLEEMTDHVDAAMILGTNWDAHIERALVFMKAKKPVLIDKPVVGSIRDCDRLRNLKEKHGAHLFGGSSLRYAREITSLRGELSSRDDLVSASACGPGDFFSYGIHTTEMLQGFAGTGIRSVKAVASGRFPVFCAEYAGGLAAFLHLQMEYNEWSLTANTTAGFRAAVVSAEGLYEPFLESFVRSAGTGSDVDEIAGPLEAVRVHLAAKIALKSGNAVFLDDLPPGAGFDGRAFTAHYAASKDRQSSAALPG